METPTTVPPEQATVSSNPHLTPEAWTQLHGWLKENTEEENYKSWLQPLRLMEGQGASASNAVTLSVPTRFMRDWVMRHYTELLLQGLHTIGMTHMTEVNFMVVSAAAAPAQKRAVPPAASVQTLQNSPVQAPKNDSLFTKEGGRGIISKGNPLDPRFTFDNFVVGKSNEFAYQAARRIAESTDVVYNPFFLYGGVGLGKTHLMQAVAWQISRTSPKRKILYISSEKFLYQFVRALRDKSVMDFKEAFRSVDLLMVDDIQFIAGKEATQEEFFHTFDTLVNDRKQVILTADKSPHEMTNIEDRLRSRLGWGLATEIHKPSMETRLAILEKKASSIGIELNRDVSLFLADRIATNVRELEGALNRIAAHATLMNQTLTVETVQDLLKDLFRVYNKVVTLEEIQKKVAEYFSIRISDMHSSRRSRNIARPRQVAMYLAKKLTACSFPDIGKSFGGRDHTTVIHACKTIEKLLKETPALQEDVSLLEKLLTAGG